MTQTFQLYDHTVQKFASGGFIAAHSYKVMLCSAVTFVAANTTLAGITKTEIAASNGYIAGGIALTGVAISIFATNDAKFDADTASVTASGGPISAPLGILYNNTAADDPPLGFLNFGGTIVASAGVPFEVRWHDDGIVLWNYQDA